MAFPNYTLADTIDGTVSITLLTQQIQNDTAITGQFDGITQTGANFTLIFIATPSAADQSQCDALVAAHSGLDPYKDEKILQILTHRSKRLETSIRAEYPAASGLMFSCSEKSQGDWAKLVSMQSLGLVAYPFTVYTFNERGSHALTDAADLNGAVAAVSTAVIAERQQAQTFIDAVIAAPDEAAVDAAAAPYLAM